MDPVVKPRGDIVGFTGPRNNTLRATERSVAISGLWHEIASSKLTVFPRNDEKDVNTI